MSEHFCAIHLIANFIDVINRFAGAMGSFVYNRMLLLLFKENFSYRVCVFAVCFSAVVAL